MLVANGQRACSLKSKKWQAFFWGFIAFNTITSLVDAVIIFPQCAPLEYIWNQDIEGHCWSATAINATGIAQGGIDALISCQFRTLT